MKKEPQFKNEKDKEIALNCFLTTDRAKEVIRTALYIAIPVLKWKEMGNKSRAMENRKKEIVKEMRTILSAISEWHRDTPDEPVSLMDTLKEKYPDIKDWNI